VDVNEHQVLPGDLLLLCSDGFHGSLSAQEIAVAVGRCHDLHENARGLISLARERDGTDNISVQLIRIRQVERMGMYRGRPYKLR
jgi:PPM family protein phosphatase